MKNETNTPLPEDLIIPCKACGHGFDLLTEDPQLPGFCRDCGDKLRKMTADINKDFLDGRAWREYPGESQPWLSGRPTLAEKLTGQNPQNN